jgi:hypothetical protein
MLVWVGRCIAKERLNSFPPSLEAGKRFKRFSIPLRKGRNKQPIPN